MPDREEILTACLIWKWVFPVWGRSLSTNWLLALIANNIFYLAGVDEASPKDASPIRTSVEVLEDVGRPLRTGTAFLHLSMHSLTNSYFVHPLCFLVHLYCILAALCHLHSTLKPHFPLFPCMQIFRCIHSRPRRKKNFGRIPYETVWSRGYVFQHDKRQEDEFDLGCGKVSMWKHSTCSQKLVTLDLLLRRLKN